MVHFNGVSRAFILTIVALTFAACSNQPTTYSPNNTDKFVNKNGDIYSQANRVLQGDYLFMVDTSYSMQSKAQEFASTLNNFTADLAAQGIDYQVGFAEGTFQDDGTLNGNIPSAFGTGFMGSVLTPSNASSNGVLSYIDQYVGGVLNPNRTAILEGAKRIMSNQSGTFVRRGAQLIYVFVTDVDDQSASFTGNASYNASYYANQLVAYKPSSQYVSARAIVAGYAGGCTTQNGDVTGTIIHNTVVALNSGSPGPTDYCIYNSANLTLSSVAQNVTHLTNRFQLQGVPILSTLTITVNGVNIPSAGNWSFNSPTNEVIFASGKAPAASASVDILYKIRFVLSHTPEISTLQVVVNGTTVSPDPTNGWAYNTTTNEIIFNGSSYPPTGATVAVNYIVQ